MKNTLTAIAALFFSVAALISIRSPFLPLFATAGTLTGAHLLTVHPGSKSRRLRKLEAEKEARRRQMEQEHQSQLAVVEERSQLVETTRINALSALEQQGAHLQETEQRLRTEKERLEQRSKDIDEWAKDFQQRTISLTVKALKENQQLKQPDLPEGGEYEDLIAEKICWLLHKHFIICKATTVRPFIGGFTMSFGILPALPDIDELGEEHRYVQGVAEAKKRIEADLLTEIQGNIVTVQGGVP